MPKLPWGGLVLATAMLVLATLASFYAALAGAQAETVRQAAAVLIVAAGGVAAYTVVRGRRVVMGHVIVPGGHCDACGTRADPYVAFCPGCGDLAT